MLGIGRVSPRKWFSQVSKIHFLEKMSYPKTLVTIEIFRLSSFVAVLCIFSIANCVVVKLY